MEVTKQLKEENAKKPHEERLEGIQIFKYPTENSILLNDCKKHFRKLLFVKHLNGGD